MREATRQGLVYSGYLVSGVVALLIRHLKWVANNKMMFGKRGVWLAWAVLEVPFHRVGGSVGGRVPTGHSSACWDIESWP